MKRYFADTFYFLALWNPEDAAHENVRDFTSTLEGQLITTDWIMMEVGNAMCGLGARNRFSTFLRFARYSSNVRILGASRKWFDRGSVLYAQREDKEWSMTDCISYAVMKKSRLVDVLTGDHHFAQMGFNAIFVGN